MHENREISRTSCSKEQDRSAKAINQTADMHVPEKSDCAVVPMNQSNREAQASAESGEGRAQGVQVQVRPGNLFLIRPVSFRPTSCIPMQCTVPAFCSST